jgi:putative cardiolipin synthase
MLRCPAWLDRAKRAARAGLLVGAALAIAGCASLPEPPPRSASQALPASPASPLAQLAAAGNTDPQLSGVVLMATGQMALHTRLELLRRAGHTLDVQAYHIADDPTGRTQLRLLRDAAERGVRVRLLLDDLYTSGHDELLLGLAAHANVELRLFNPFPAGRGSLVQRFSASLFDFGRVHRRMHNKMLLADGAMAIVGGRNIADDYFMQRAGDNFLDLDALVIGAILPTLGELFDAYWNSRQVRPIESIVTTSLPAAELRQRFDALTGPGTTPPPAPPGVADRYGQGLPFTALDAGRAPWVWARVEAFADNPDKILGTETPQDAAPPLDRHGIRHRLVERIRAAQTEVLVCSPYVVPTRRSLDTIALLQQRGVRMTVLTNSLAATDEPLVHSAYRRYREEMLRQGIELYELTPLRLTLAFGDVQGEALGRLHAKTVVIDREIFYIGSFNFDHRSATHNTELGLIVFSPQLAEQALTLLDAVKRESAHRLRLAADGRRIEWHGSAADGSAVVTGEPEVNWSRRWLLELVGPFVPEDLL